MGKEVVSLPLPTQSTIKKENPMKQFIQDLQQLCNKHHISIIGEDILYKNGELIEGEIEILEEE